MGMIHFDDGDYPSYAELEKECAALKIAINNCKQTIFALEGQRDRLKAEVVRLNGELETERMRLAGCGVAALADTEETRKQRIDKDNPYWSASYGDVCRTVDKLMEIRKSCRELVDAMHRYEMDTDEEAPFKHREMMRRAEQALSTARRRRERLRKKL